MKFIRINALLLACVALIGSCNTDSSVNENTLFTMLNSNKTGIDFANHITENDSINILEYEYIYNGGGVAVADFNNDGLSDVFFSGNMVSNALYQNKGDLKFDDVSKSAGIEGTDKWCSGIAVVDINQDGLSDIYVAVSTPYRDELRGNLLFINTTKADGAIQFDERATEYGLDDSGYSINSAFFDYDNDGDLDLFIINNQMQDKKNPSNYKRNKKENFSGRVDKLYRNDSDGNSPIYTDVTKESGIVYEGYSLGLNIVDLNRDGWKDIFITNDFISEDIIYINNQDGTFTNKAGEYFKHTSHSAMGNDVVDINNDGLVDILALDMLPEDNYRKKTMMGPNNYTTYNYNKRFNYAHQYVRNTLQVNQGGAVDEQLQFSELAMTAGIEATDWSWAPLVADFDMDGYRDIIITNGFPKDVTDRDFIDFHASNYGFTDQSKLLAKIPEVKIANYAYRNLGNVHFENVSSDWGLNTPSFSNGAAYSDLDNDGDLDFIVNNINDPAFVFRNNSKRNSSNNYIKIKLQGAAPNIDAVGTIIEYTTGSINGIYEHSVSRGYLSCVDPVIFIGLGADSIVDLDIIWPNGEHSFVNNSKANQFVEINYDPASIGPKTQIGASFSLFTPSTAFPECIIEEADFIDYNFEPLLFHKFSQFGPAVTVADYNGDGRDDYYISGSAGNEGRMFRQTPSGQFVEGNNVEVNKDKEELGSLFFDADGDGDLDLYICSGSNEFEKGSDMYKDVLLINQSGKFVDASESINIPNTSSSCVRAADYDLDGDLDLFVGTRVIPHEYPKAATSYILQNNSVDGKVQFDILEGDVVDALNNIGLVSDALWTDFDLNGTIDLVIAGEWMPITFISNDGGKFTNVTANSGISDITGWWNSIAPADFDNDGDIDFVVSNFGTNSTIRASKEMPVRIYVDDFDDNGSLDAIPSVFLKDTMGEFKEFAYHGRGDIFKELIRVNADFGSHHKLGITTMDGFLSEEERSKATVVNAVRLETSYIENLGSQKFRIHDLPAEAQWAPVYGMSTEDVNDDGHTDVIMVGNDFGMEVRTGRMDAFNGLVLLGDGKGGFNTMLSQETGFYVPGDGKGLAMIKVNDRVNYIATQNNANIAAFETQTESKFFTPDHDDYRVLFNLADGKNLSVVELYHGAGFLSQSSRAVKIPQGTASLTVYKYDQTGREIEVEK